MESIFCRFREIREKAPQNIPESRTKTERPVQITKMAIYVDSCYNIQALLRVYTYDLFRAGRISPLDRPAAAVSSRAETLRKHREIS